MFLSSLQAIGTAFKYLSKQAPSVITQTKVLLASKEEKQLISLVKFIIILGSYLGVDNIEVLEKLNTEDLLLLASIIAKHTYIKYIFLALTVHYCFKALLSIDLLKVALKGFYSIPTALKFIAVKVIIGFVVMALNKEITFKDYLREIFYIIFYAYKKYYINTIASQQVIHLQKKNDILRLEMLQIQNNINPLSTKKELEEMLNKKQEELKNNQKSINLIRENQNADLKDIARSLAFNKIDDENQ